MGHPLVQSVPNLKYDIFGFITLRRPQQRYYVTLYSFEQTTSVKARIRV